MAARSYPFVQVDVFTDRIFGGNPLAVFLNGDGLSNEEMQRIAREMNLSETTFLFPPEAPEHTARVRIFTPGNELPFAGHPTIGTAYVLATRGLAPTGATSLVLEEGIGSIPVRLEGAAQAPTFLWMAHGRARFEPPVSKRAAVAAALSLAESDLLDGAPIESGTTGVPHLYVALRDRDRVDRAVLRMEALLEVCGPAVPAVFVFAPDGLGRVYSRMFAPHTVNIPEDPATGSASGPLGAYLVRHGLAPDGEDARIVSEQGTKMGRQSFVHIAVRSVGGRIAAIEVGGSAVPVLEGTLTLP